MKAKGKQGKTYLRCAFHPSVRLTDESENSDTRKQQRNLVAICPPTPATTPTGDGQYRQEQHADGCRLFTSIEPVGSIEIGNVPDKPLSVNVADPDHQWLALKLVVAIVLLVAGLSNVLSIEATLHGGETVLFQLFGRHPHIQGTPRFHRQILLAKNVFRLIEPIPRNLFVVP